MRKIITSLFVRKVVLSQSGVFFILEEFLFRFYKIASCRPFVFPKHYLEVL